MTWNFNEQFLKELHLQSILRNLFVLIIFLLNGNCYGEGLKISELLKVNNISIYHPENFGLRDLSFEIKYSKMEKRLSSLLGEIPLKDIKIEVYWLSDGRVDAEVFGLPKGFIEVKQELINFALSKIPFIFPISMEESLKNYNLKDVESGKEEPSNLSSNNEESNKYRSLYASPKNGQALASSMILLFDNQEMIHGINSQYPIGIEFITFEWKKISSCQNKNLLSKMEINLENGTIKNRTTYDIEIDRYSGFCLPKVIKVHTSVSSRINNSEKVNDKLSQNFESEMEVIFSNYETNTGKAQNYFYKKRKI